jgi:hypothetical protein
MFACLPWFSPAWCGLFYIRPVWCCNLLRCLSSFGAGDHWTAPEWVAWRICTTHHFLDLVEVMGEGNILCELYLSSRYDLSATNFLLSEARSMCQLLGEYLSTAGWCHGLLSLATSIKILDSLYPLKQYDSHAHGGIIVHTTVFLILWYLFLRIMSTAIDVSLRHSDRPSVSNNSRLDQTTINRLESIIYWTLP